MSSNESPNSVKERAKRKLERDMGPELLALLRDPKVVEIMLNDDGSVWVDRLGEGQTYVTSLRAAQGQAIIETVAGYHGKEVNDDSPKIEAELPLDGSRFAGQLAKVTVRGYPAFAIRKRAVSIFTLEQYVENGVMTQKQKDLLVKFISEEKNILVVGSTGTGKTTLANALINEAVNQFPSTRFIIIEDTPEIQCAAKNAVQYRTSATETVASHVKTALRMNGDRILVGEVRGEEAMDLLTAWNTGHEGGIATIHANKGPLSGLARFKTLVTMHPRKPDPIEPFIGEAVHVLVHIAVDKKTHRRKVEDIIRVSGFENGQYVTEIIKE
ncbi:P-type conjugative transfer ATPase TrbB [Vibrio diabolicus]|uniref:P-type conjugative transfer ATPase TrbB n=1 Tax=Vibrio diabolicus TaxID=50719 RepID=UPI00193C1351|nr:P-type conjugative transfer ATPase TrbB [Vibrio diabolicus]EGQ8485003.1 P-type conjugative transfer ATPase TrbB [Vibrio parahaemolyticus]EGQ9696295.1 P-type conjugative transfer ATPase TrbB [Vibrio parahaemolyticus]EJX1342494.1 P-type conjugative transfer ATPase TrbB [Vibrio parahaemolyticus]HCH1696716.1 P-type conjugative transfer ATPase TrbB [Vibrio parahaemolyticus]